MNTQYENILGSERTVEVEFINSCLKRYITSPLNVLDVGGIPSKEEDHRSVYETLNHLKMFDYQYDICDFRGGKYQGDFVTIDIPQIYDIVIFLSSLEHFPQCTEGDLKFREGEDRKGFEKALKVLKPKGKIFLTVPFGKHIWQPYHQNYDYSGILELSKGSKIVEQYVYRLKDNTWELVDNLNDMLEVRYTNKAYGVGCFVFEKE